MLSEIRLSTLFLFCVSVSLSGLAYGQNNSDQNEETAMERVTGIGGLFIRANDPGKLAEWYEEHLGVTRSPTSYEDEPWQQEQGPTIFAPFENDTEFFGRPSQSWMINFRVNDLDAMVKQLEMAGIEVEVDKAEYPNGRFARLLDPESNPIQLWQPKTSD